MSAAMCERSWKRENRRVWTDAYVCIKIRVMWFAYFLLLAHIESRSRVDSYSRQTIVEERRGKGNDRPWYCVSWFAAKDDRAHGNQDLVVDLIRIVSGRRVTRGKRAYKWTTFRDQTDLKRFTSCSIHHATAIKETTTPAKIGSLSEFISPLPRTSFFFYSLRRMRMNLVRLQINRQLFYLVDHVIHGSFGRWWLTGDDHAEKVANILVR